jgi:hypothetical protein
MASSVRPPRAATAHFRMSMLTRFASPLLITAVIAF